MFVPCLNITWQVDSVQTQRKKSADFADYTDYFEIKDSRFMASGWALRSGLR